MVKRLYVKDLLTVNVKYCGFFLAEHEHLQIVKTRITCKIFETIYFNTPFQGVKRREI